MLLQTFPSHVFFVNSWCSTMIYHKIDPSSILETEQYIAWSASIRYVSAINRFVCTSTIIIKNSKLICLIDKESQNLMRFPNTQHSPERQVFLTDPHPWQNSGDIARGSEGLSVYRQGANVQAPQHHFLWVWGTSSKEQGLRATNIS